VQATLQAQSPSKKSKFKIGDQLPEITLRNLINYAKTTESLSSFHGKTVVLYFWNQGCTSSIQNWPHLLRLQETYNRSVQIILVNVSQDIKAVQKIVGDQKRIVHVNMTLPISCQDIELGELFPRNSVPHLVWIGASGTLLAITGGDELNEENVKALDEGKNISLTQKDGIKYRVDFSKPLFVRSNGGDGEHLLWQSVVSEYFPGLTADTGIDSCSGTLANVTLITMFRYLFKEETNRFGALNLFPVSQVSLKVRDTTRYMTRVNGDLRKKNFYTYQVYSKKPQSIQTMRSMMVSDLKRYFGVNCYWSKQKKLCLVLTSNGNSNIKYQGGDSILAIRPTDINLNNVTWKEFLENLLAVTDYHYSPYPLIDETGFKDKIGRIQFEANIIDHHDLDSALNKYGIHFTLQEREVDVLVIFEPDYFTPEANVKMAN
jgi:thiol-disulfide isomerase/thioredoxin